MFLLLLIIGSQIRLMTCPPVHKHGKDCDLADQRLVLKHQTREKFRRILQDVTAVTNVAREDVTTAKSEEEEEGKTRATLNPNVTLVYWNVTNERCDYERIRCMRAHATGAVCARTLYYRYYSFPNYCALEFHNCIMRYEGIWTIAYMGICTELDIEKEIYVDLGYDQMTNTSFLTQMYIADSGDLTNVG